MTTAEHWPGSLLVTMLAGQLMTGFLGVIDRYRNEQLDVLPAASVAVHVTVVEPIGKLNPTQVNN